MARATRRLGLAAFGLMAAVALGQAECRAAIVLAVHPERYSFNLGLSNGVTLGDGALIVDFQYIQNGFTLESQKIVSVDVSSGQGAVTLSLPNTVTAERFTLAGTTTEHAVVLAVDATNTTGINAIQSAANWDALFGANGIYIGPGLAAIGEADLEQTLKAHTAEAILNNKFSALFNAPFAPIGLGNHNVNLTFFGFSGPMNLGGGTASDDPPSPPLATPEPSSLVSASMAVAIGLGYAWRRRRRA